MTPPQRIVVCVPTYRRPVQLRELLLSLKAQRDVDPFLIVVGNNDTTELSTYPALVDPALPAFDVISVRIRGVSAVRNALLAHATSIPGIDRIAFIDDDQIPEADWLAELLAAAHRYRADIVGGPVFKSVVAPTFWSRGAADTSYLPMESGAVATLNEAGNLLLSTQILARLRRPPFRLDFGRTGGEDYEFFLHAREAGACFAWASNARVHERLPSDRLSFGGFVWRYYAIAAYQARADRLHGRTSAVLGAIVREPLVAPLKLARSLLRDRSVAMSVGLIIRCVAVTAGRVVGFMGVHAERYATDESRGTTATPTR